MKKSKIDWKFYIIIFLITFMASILAIRPQSLSIVGSEANLEAGPLKVNVASEDSSLIKDICLAFFGTVIFCVIIFAVKEIIINKQKLLYSNKRKKKRR